MFVHSCVHVCSFSEGLSLTPKPVFGPGSKATIFHTEIKSESNTDVCSHPDVTICKVFRNQ